MADIRLDVANLVGLIMQAVLYGIFQALFVACIYVLVYGRVTDTINWHFIITAIVMWLLIGMNFALSWSRIMEAFIDRQPLLRDDPNAIVSYFGDLGQWKEVARTAAYVALTAVADSLFIYRLYIVWGRNKYIIILPILLLCGSLTSGVGIEVVIGTTSSDLFGTSLAGWATSFFSISLVQNIITTFLIVFRIWRVNIDVARGPGSRSLWPVISVILESGAIYSSTLLVLLSTYASGSFSQYIALDMLVPIIGITFTLIIVRVGLGISQGASAHRGNNNNFSTQPSVGRFPLQRLNITVQKSVTVDHDLERNRPAKGADDGSDNYSDTWDPKLTGTTVAV
ncbi:hypothetical protein M422DRAFT_774492 [Sphaerobolus stellatus SS14]|nr:hypothetical protein M422DRAFT_774492 [Sphaerobolus stellatus SS14]